MGKIYINCSRCGKDLECEELDDVYTSRIDDNFLCKECFEKEKPDYIQQLKQQVDEKDKEIAYMTKQAKKFNNEAQKYYEDAYCNGYNKQLAIQELEKIKNKCDGMYDLWLNSKYKENMYDNEDIAGVFEDISVFTNDLIKKLKGENNENL